MLRVYVNWQLSPEATLMAENTRRSQRVPELEALNKPHSVTANDPEKLIVATERYSFAEGFD